MVRTLDANQTPKADSPYIQPIYLIHLILADETLYFSDRNYYFNSINYEDYLFDLSGIESQIRNFGGYDNSKLTLRFKNDKIRTQNTLIDFFDLYPPEKKYIEIYKLLINTGETFGSDVSTKIFKGELGQPYEIYDPPTSFKIDCSLMLFGKNVSLPLDVIDLADFPGADPDDVGKYRNIIYGDVKKVICPWTVAGGVTTLTADINDVETSIIVSDASGFSALTSAIIANEEVRITVINTNTLTVTRGYNSTTATVHNKGDIFYEKRTDFEVEVAQHPVKSIGDIYAKRGDEWFRILTGATKYIDSGGRAKIVFSEKISFEQKIDISATADNVMDEGTHPHDLTFPGYSTRKCLPTGASGGTSPANAIDGNENTQASATNVQTLTVTFTETDLGTINKQYIYILHWTATGTVQCGGATISAGLEAPASKSWSRLVKTTANNWNDNITITGIEFGDNIYEVYKEIEYTPEATADTHAATGIDAATTVDITGNSVANTAIGDIVACDVEGYGDDGSGTYTGTPNALIERPDHVRKHILIALLGFTAEDIGASFVIAGSIYAGQISGGYKFSFVLHEVSTEAMRLFEEMDIQSRSNMFESGGQFQLAFNFWGGKNIWLEVASTLGAETIIYSLAVYNGKLYGGTHQNGKLYEWNGTNAWVEVAPKLGAEASILSLAVHNNKLYGGTRSYGKLYEWNGTNAWVEVAPTLGTQSDIYSLAVYNDKLYGGTFEGGRLYEWNGTNAWVQKAPMLGAETTIFSLAVYNGKLYGGTYPNGKLLEWNDINAWVEVAPKLGTEMGILSLAVHNNKLYGGTRSGGKLYEWNGTNAWVEVASTLGAETHILSLAVHNNKLYGGTRPNGKLYEWNDTNAWVEVAPTYGAETYIYSLAVYNGKLYGGTYQNGKLLEWHGPIDLVIQKTFDGDSIKGPFLFGKTEIADIRNKLRGHYFRDYSKFGSSGESYQKVYEITSQVSISKYGEMQEDFNFSCIGDLASMIIDVLSYDLLQKKGLKKIAKFNAFWDAMIIEPCDYFSVVSSFDLWNGLNFKTTLWNENPGNQRIDIEGTEFKVEDELDVLFRGILPSYVDGLGFLTTVYAAVYDSGVWRYDEGDQWTNMGKPGSLSPRTLLAFGGFLYCGTYGTVAGNAKVYKLVDGSWSLIGSALDSNKAVYSMVVFEGTIYVGTWPSGIVYRLDAGPVWTSVGQLGSSTSILSLVDLNGILYGTSHTGNVFRYDGGTTWVQIGTTVGSRLVVHLGQLYGVVLIPGSGTYVYKYNSGTSWNLIGAFTEASYTRGEICSFNDELYISIGSSESKIYRYKGTPMVWDLSCIFSSYSEYADIYSLIALDSAIWMGFGDGRVFSFGYD